MISEQRGNAIHGILLIALFSLSAFYIAGFQWVKNLSLSPLIVGIILGMLYANSLRNYIPATWVPGIKVCTKQILRAGIVLYGFRLTLQQVFDVGLPAFLTDTIIICGTIGLGILLGRWLKMDWDTALMTSTGSAICGAAAVLGAEPVAEALQLRALVGDHCAEGPGSALEFFHKPGQLLVVGGSVVPGEILLHRLSLNTFPSRPVAAIKFAGLANTSTQRISRRVVENEARRMAVGKRSGIDVDHRHLDVGALGGDHRHGRAAHVAGADAQDVSLELHGRTSCGGALSPCHNNRGTSG